MYFLNVKMWLVMKGKNGYLWLSSDLHRQNCVVLRSLGVSSFHAQSSSLILQELYVLKNASLQEGNKMNNDKLVGCLLGHHTVFSLLIFLH